MPDTTTTISTVCISVPFNQSQSQPAIESLLSPNCFSTTNPEYTSNGNSITWRPAPATSRYSTTTSADEPVQPSARFLMASEPPASRNTNGTTTFRLIEMSVIASLIR